jgi:hypothetical protein
LTLSLGSIPAAPEVTPGWSGVSNLAVSRLFAAVAPVLARKTTVTGR